MMTNIDQTLTNQKSLGKRPGSAVYKGIKNKSFFLDLTKLEDNESQGNNPVPTKSISNADE